MNLEQVWKYIVYILFIYLDIDLAVFQVLMIFMVLDTVSGMIKILRIDYTKFSLKLLVWGMLSKIGILIIPLVVALLGKGLSQDFTMGVDVILDLLLVSEFLSVITNIYTIKTKVILKDIDVFTLIFKSLRSSALAFLHRYQKPQDNEKI